MGVVAAAVLLVPVSANAAPDDMDPTFSGDGLALPLGTEGAGTDVAIDSEGRIIASFSSTSSSADGGVVRLLPDGSLDPSFSGDGIFRYGGFSSTTRVAVDPLDRILLAGWEVPGGQTVVSNVVRITEGGALDSSFDGNGSRGLGRMVVSALQVRPDSRVVLAVTPPNTHLGGGPTAAIPEDSSRASVLQLTVSGAPDPSFGSSGSAPVDPDFAGTIRSGLTDLVLDDLGRAVALVRIWFAGVSPNEPSWIAVRLEANGDPDASFNGGDPTRSGYIPLDRAWGSVDTDSSQRILLAGADFNLEAGASFTVVRRLTVDGSADGGFGVAGTSVADLAPASDIPQEIVSGPDGKIWIAGHGLDPGGGPDSPPGPDSFLLGRLTQTGAVDASFSGDGNASAEIGSGERMALDSLGRVVMVGRGDGSPTPHPQGLLVARYLGDGGVSGPLPTPPPGGGGSGGAGGVAGGVATNARNVNVHKVVVPKSRRKLATRGIKVLASCDEGCRIVLEVEVSQSVANGMGLMGTLLAKRWVPADAGERRWVRARFNADVRRALRGYGGGGRLRVNVTGVAL